MELVLHEAVRSALSTITRRPAGSYLFYGPAGVGKFSAALELARTLNCQRQHPANEPCTSCAQFAAGTYPDLIIVRPEDKPSITIEQIRRTVTALNLQPYYQTGTRTIIIDSADAMTIDAANALLKLLEEPPPRTLFILVAPTAESLLPTIRSRTAGIYFPLPSREQVTQLLESRHQVASSEAQRLTDAAVGAPGAAITLATDPQAAALRLDLASQAQRALTQTRFGRLRLAAALTAASADLSYFARLLHARIADAIAQNTMLSPQAAANLAALEQFRRQLSAKVAPRVALERLMLELL